MTDGDTGLRVVEFPSLLQSESKILGVYTTQELLAMFLGSSAVWLCLKPLGIASIGAAAAVFAVMAILKAVVPEEVGYAFPLYEARFAVKKRIQYAYEEGTTKYITSLKFVDNWVLKLRSGYAAVIEVQPVNFFYATPAEQRAIVSAYASALETLDFPIQIISLSCEFDVSCYLNRFVLRLKDDDVVSNPLLSDLARGYLRYLDEVAKRAYRRRYFVVVFVPAEKDEQVALGELRRRLETAAAALGRGGLHTRILERDDVLQLYELIVTRRTLPKNYSSAKLLFKIEKGAGEVVA